METNSDGSGSVFVFVRSGTTWVQQAYLKASNAGPNDNFASSVAISGDTVVVGAPNEDSNAVGVNGNGADNSATNSGAVYVFVRNETTWTQQAYLKASNTQPNDNFGRSVAISGDTVVVGAPNEDSNAVGLNGNGADNSAGAAYVFVRSGTTWTQQAYLKASNTDANAHFGGSVAIANNNTVVVGAVLEASTTGEKGNNASINHIYLEGSILAAQVHLKGNGNQADSGVSGPSAAYIFVHNGTAWTQQAYVNASKYKEEADSMGYIETLATDMVVVGPDEEDGNAIGANCYGANNGAPDSGAAFVFTRNGTTWVQQAYLKADEAHFGTSVAVSGRTVVIGTSSSGRAYTFYVPLPPPPPPYCTCAICKECICDGPGCAVPCEWVRL